MTTEYSLESQEAYLIVLIQYVSDSVRFSEGKWSRDEELKEHRKQFAERLIFLQQYKCDPWNELKLFEYRLERPPVKKQTISKKKEFDIGRITKTHHMEAWDTEAISAYAFLRFCEEAGISFRLPGLTIGKKSAEGTLSRINKYSPYWASATMVRIGDEKAVGHILSRESLQNMETATVDKQIDIYLNTISGCWDDIQSSGRFGNQNFGILFATVIPEILSRLCCKCSTISKDKILNILIEIYKSKKKLNFSKISNLTKLLMESYSQKEKYERILKLLEFPVVDKDDFRIQIEYRNPFEFLNIVKKYTINWEEPKLSAQHVDTLLKDAGSTNPEKRKWSTRILDELRDLDLLEESQVKRYGEILWKQKDEHGLPDSTNFYRFALITRPHPNAVDPVQLVKSFILNSSLPIQKNKKENGISMTGGRVPLCDEIVGASTYIHWSEDDVVKIFDRLVAWWNSDKEYLNTDDEPSFMDSIEDEFKARFEKLIDVLVDVVAPALEEKADEKKKMSTMLSEMIKYGLPTLRLETACIRIFPESKNKVINHIEEALASSDLSVVVDGLRSVLTALKLPKSFISAAELSRLLSLLGQMIKWRRRTGLQNVLNVVTRVLNEYPLHFTEELETFVLSALPELAADTDLTTESEELDFSEKLAVRKETAQMSFALFEFYQDHGKSVPNTVHNWRDICTYEKEFSEIRNQWVA